MSITSVLADAVRRGLPVVPTIGKRPAIAWQRFVTEPPTAADLKEWQALPNVTGLALVIGPALWRKHAWLWALDIEAEHRAEAEAWLDQHAPGWRDGLVVETGGGGVHVYCLAPGAVRTRHCPWGEIRGEGALCVLPPSVHPETGRPYRWLSRGQPVRLNPGNIPAAAANGRATGAGVPVEVLGEPIREGERNQTLTSIAGSLRARGADPATLEAVLLAVNAARCDPPLPAEEVKAIARSVSRYEPGQGNGVAPIAPTIYPQAVVGAITDSSSKTPFVRATDLLAQAGQESGQQWYPVLGLEGLVGPGVATLLSGRPKGGKSTLLAHAAQEWLERGLTVAWLSEEARSRWAERLADLKGLAHEGLHLAFADPAMRPDDWLAALQSLRPQVIIIDTARVFLGIRDENDPVEVHAKLFPFILLARTLNAALVVCHHRNKYGDAGEGLDHSGSHAFVGDVDIAISLLEVPEHPRRRELRARSRWDETPARVLVELGEDGAYRALGDPGQVSQAEVGRRVLALLNGDWRTTTEVWESLAEPRPSKELVRLALQRLWRQGAVERETGRGRTPDRWRVPPTVCSNNQEGDRVSVVGTNGGEGTPDGVVPTTGRDIVVGTNRSGRPPGAGPPGEAGPWVEEVF
jgi:hypothetical protein